MGDVRDPNTDQTLPIPNGRRPIVDIVRDDLLERKEHGVRKYGQALQAFNGRDPVQDAFEESVDLMLYLKQLLEENAAFDHYYVYEAGGVECDRCGTSLLVEYENVVPFGELLWRVRKHEMESHPNG